MASSSTLSSLFKELYGDSIADLIPEGVRLLDKIFPRIKFNKTNNITITEYHIKDTVTDIFVWEE